jgi:hypothetical protein
MRSGVLAKYFLMCGYERGGLKLYLLVECGLCEGLSGEWGRAKIEEEAGITRWTAEWSVKCEREEKHILPSLKRVTNSKLLIKYY